MRPLPHRARVAQRPAGVSVQTIARVRGEDLDLADDESWIAIQEF